MTASSNELRLALAELRALRAEVVTLQMYTRGHKEDVHQRRAFKRVKDKIDARIGRIENG